MRECIYCEAEGTEKYGYPGKFVGGKYAGVQAYACKDHAENYPVNEKKTNFRLTNIVEERQARRDFSNKFYCGY